MARLAALLAVLDCPKEKVSNLQMRALREMINPALQTNVSSRLHAEEEPGSDEVSSEQGVTGSPVWQQLPTIERQGIDTKNAFSPQGPEAWPSKDMTNPALQTNHGCSRLVPAEEESAWREVSDHKPGCSDHKPGCESNGCSSEEEAGREVSSDGGVTEGESSDHDHQLSPTIDRRGIDMQNAFSPQRPEGCPSTYLMNPALQTDGSSSEEEAGREVSSERGLTEGASSDHDSDHDHLLSPTIERRGIDMENAFSQQRSDEVTAVKSSGVPETDLDSQETLGEPQNRAVQLEIPRPWVESLGLAELLVQPQNRLFTIDPLNRSYVERGRAELLVKPQNRLVTIDP
ncbi:unnamed protein product [Calypogeia fissa]